MTFADRMYMARIWLRIASDYEKAARRPRPESAPELATRAVQGCCAAAADARRLAASCFTNPAPNFINFAAD